MGTKAITVPEDPLATAKPDKLYGLEIWQYDRAGNCINNSTQNLGNKSIGESFTVPLVDLATLSTPETECQLLIVARGYNGSKNTIESLKGKRYSGHDAGFFGNKLDNDKGSNKSDALSLASPSCLYSEGGRDV